MEKTNITANSSQKEESDNLFVNMVKYSEELLRTGEDQVTFQRILGNILEISKAKYGILTLLNENTNKFTTVDIAGFKNELFKVKKILGFNLVGKEWPDYLVKNQKLEKQVVSRFSSLSELTGNIFLKTITEQLEKLLGIKEVIVIKIIVNDQMIGDITLIIPTGRQLENEMFLEMYSRQINMFVTRFIAEKELTQAKEYFELAFNNSPDAVSISRLSDGFYVNVNKIFSVFTGFSYDEVIGKTSLQLGLFNNPSDRQSIVAELNQKGYCKNVEVTFCRKDGSKFTGSVSAEIITIHGVAYIYNSVRDVTARILEQEKLQESEEKFKLLHESAGVGIGYYTPDGVVISYNELAASHMGGHPEDYVGKSIYELFSEDAAKFYLDRIQKAVTSAKIQVYEDKVDLPGETKWFSSAFSRIINASNIVAGVQIISTDISKQKRTEIELRDSEAFSHGIINALSDNLAILDETGTIIAVNRAWKSFSENNSGNDSLLSEGVNYLSICDSAEGQNSEESAQFAAGIRAVLHGKQDEFSLEYPCHSPNEKRWFVGKVTRFSFKGSNCIAIAHENITSRKLAEAALYESEKKHRLLVTEMQQGLAVHEIVLDKNGRPVDYRFLDINDSFELLTGLKREIIIGKTVLEVLPNTEKYWIEKYGHIAITGEPLHYENYSKELDKYFEITAYSPQPQQFAVIVADITERKQVSEKIKNLNLELEDRVHERTLKLEIANQELSEFSYTISHDLRSPLRAINGYSQIILDEFVEMLDPEVNEYLNLIRKNSILMGTLVDDLLNYSQLGKQELTKTKVSVLSVVNEIVASMNQDDKQKIKVDIHSLLDCNASATLLRQVFENLISNALKFSKNIEKPLIEIGYTHATPPQKEDVNQKELPCYFVKDNGIGFNMDYHEKLFGVFQRLNRADDYEGTGVGLAIVHRIVTKHGGIIWAESKLGEGSTFYFTMG